jgi:hypothetical protein
MNTAKATVRIETVQTNSVLEVTLREAARGCSRSLCESKRTTISDAQRANGTRQIVGWS